MDKISKKRVFFVVMFIVFIGWIIWTNVNITTSYSVIKNRKIPEEFRDFKIAQISDFHNHQWGDKLIGRLEKESPDIIVVTGDLVDSSRTDFHIAMAFIHRALKIAPVYYVAGNHEAILSNYSELNKMLADSGVYVVDDKKEWVCRADSKINLVGVRDLYFVEKTGANDIRESIVTTKLEALLDKNCYNIVLCHRPEFFDVYVNEQADLVITGHAHGGQIRIPFLGGLFAPGQGILPEYTEGVYSREGTDMVVSRGLGNSIFPVRFNNMPELVIITLEKD